MTQHTETPWVIDSRATTHILSDSGRPIASAGGYANNADPDGGIAENKANAEYIVHACNSHAKLVEALEEILRRFEIGQCDFDGCADLADEALQQLKSKGVELGEDK